MMAKLRRWLTRGALAIGAASAGAVAVVTAASILATPQPLASALEGEGRIYRWRRGSGAYDIFYKVRGPATARPLLLLHSINGGPSSWEVRKAFAALGTSFRVYAPDLLGFGLSDRPAIPYTADLYCDLIRDFVRDEIGASTAVVAISLTASFVIHDAVRDPDLFSQLVLVSPSGIRPTRGERVARKRVAEAVSASWFGQVIYALITNRPAIRFFLRHQAYRHPEVVDAAMVEQYYASAHQRGARHAPLAFLAGKLNLDIADDIAALRQPTLLIWGQEAAMSPVSNAELFRRLNPRADLEIIADAGLSVQDERPDEFNRIVAAWLNAYTAEAMAADGRAAAIAAPAVALPDTLTPPGPSPAETTPAEPATPIEDGPLAAEPPAEVPVAETPVASERAASVADVAPTPEPGQRLDEGRIAVEPEVVAANAEPAPAPVVDRETGIVADEEPTRQAVEETTPEIAVDEVPTQQLPAVRASTRPRASERPSTPAPLGGSMANHQAPVPEKRAQAKKPPASRPRRGRKGKK